MLTVDEFCLLGGHVVRDADGEKWFDAIDVALRLSDGTERVFGLRTREYVLRNHDDKIVDWSGYSPLPVTLDFNTVSHWDFDQVLWIGPRPRECVVWSNAQMFALRAIQTTFPPKPSNALLAGPEGRGLPLADEIGVHVPADAEWIRIAT